MWKRRYLPILFGIAIVMALAAVRIADPYPVQALREIAFDNFQRVAPRPELAVPVRIVDIDDDSLRAIGQWPWPRDILATLTERLTKLGAASIAFDVLFPEPDRMSGVGGSEPRDLDQEFAAALAESPSVLGFGVTPAEGPVPERAKSGIAVIGSDPAGRAPLMPGTVQSLPALVGVAKGLGSISLDPGGSVGTVRRLPLVWSNGSQLFPALSIEALRVAMGLSTILIFADQDGQGEIQAVRIGDFELPTAPDGAFWLYYRPTQKELYVSAADMLGPDFEQLAPLIAGNIVLIGTSATGLLDIRGTPMGSNMPGVEIHAQALAQMISGRFLIRTDWVGGLELLTFVLLGLLMVVVLLRSGPLASLVVGGIAAMLVAGGSWMAFTRWGMLVDPTFPLTASFLVYTSMIFFKFTISDSDKRAIRRAFGHYVAPALLAKIEANADAVKLGGEVRDLSIMFLDIRNFTTLSEGISPADLVKLLNTLFGALGARITAQFGTIDKFIGDAIMAFWNAPVDVEQHAFRACTAAIEMRETLKELNARDDFGLKSRDGGMKEIEIGIGIATGEALVGNLGLETRFDYSCVGDTVNVASRVEGACKSVAYDIVVVDETRSAASQLAFLEAGSIALKGKSAREPIHILVGDAEVARSPAFERLRAAHGQAIGRLQRGEDATEAIAACLRLVPDVDANLARFYRRLAERKQDFAVGEAVS